MPPGARPRLYDAVLRRHLARDRQMAFVSGPRQVGKTTVCRGLADDYLSWDAVEHRRIIAAGPAALAARLELERARRGKTVVALDELHRWPKWKGFLKGFFDVYEDRVRVLVTGSSRLDVYRRGGDSLMGRYFLYRMHPFSLGELARTAPPARPVNPPAAVAAADDRALWEHGGYPEPFLKRRRDFTVQWHRLRLRQLVREDVRDLSRVQEIGQIEVLTDLLDTRSAQRLVFRNLAGTLGASPHAVKAWTETLVTLHHGFLVRPWHRRVTRSLVKEAKWYLRDWSGIADPGARAETFVACHLLKAVEGWTDLGFGSFGLYYLRDKDQREVDFLVSRDGAPWFLVEVKASDAPLAEALPYFQRLTGARHAFQLAVDQPFRDADGFARTDPVKIAARSLLSQLL